MEKYSRRFNDEGPISIIDDSYKFPSCEYPRSLVIDSESIDYSRFNYNFTKRNKKVTIVNIQSHKKMGKNMNYNSIIDEDFNDDKKKKCVNCRIF